MKNDLELLMDKNKARKKFIFWMAVLFMFVFFMLFVVWTIANFAYTWGLTF